jgi:predicted branched-subunit amino acid permease
VRRDELSLFAALTLAVGTFGAAFGVAGIAAGIELGMVLAISAILYAGASQFGAIGVLAAGGSPLLALATVWLMNLRFVPLGLVMPPEIARSLPARLLAAHLLVDPSAAVVHGPDRARQAVLFWRSGVAMYVAWVVGTLVGALAGSAIADPQVLGLDAALPAAFVGILGGWMRHRPSRRAAIGGAAGAAVGVAVGPVGPALLLSMVGALAGLTARGDDRAAAGDGP